MHFVLATVNTRELESGRPVSTTQANTSVADVDQFACGSPCVPRIMSPVVRFTILLGRVSQRQARPKAFVRCLSLRAVDLLGRPPGAHGKRHRRLARYRSSSGMMRPPTMHGECAPPSVRPITVRPTCFDCASERRPGSLSPSSLQGAHPSQPATRRRRHSPRPVRTAG